MKILDTTHQLFTPEQAATIAAQMNASDEDWTYVAKHDPKGTGYSFIEIYEEDGEIVCRM